MNDPIKEEEVNEADFIMVEDNSTKPLLANKVKAKEVYKDKGVKEMSLAQILGNEKTLLANIDATIARKKKERVECLKRIKQLEAAAKLY